MASKLNNDSFIPLFESIGLAGPKAVEAAKNPKSAAALKEFIEKFGLANEDPLEGKQATLLAAFATLSIKNPIGEGEKHFVVRQILDGNLKSVNQLNAASAYASFHKIPFNEAEFKKECGVGFTIGPAELHSRVSEYVTSGAGKGWTEFSSTMNGINATELRWAGPLEVKNALEKVFTEKFGVKEVARQRAKELKEGVKFSDSKAKKSEEDSTSTSKAVFEEGFLGQLHKPGDNPQINPALREAHLAATGGNVYTRFPPEPNGYLHIGHSKAIFVSFGYAAHHGGKCILRYDDTNPTKEEAQYFESILEMVRWLGFEPWKITYSSDYFDKLYDLAVELIKRDKAYVCHCTREEVKINRGEKTGAARKACVHRTRPIEESLLEFENMKNGNYKPEEANLRMKQDLEDGNPQMWDLTAYRVLDAHHHRTHDKWKIYPTYDYTHCLVDSFENISHSLCTTEFIASRQSYDWLCDALEVYKPRQSEFGRLDLEGTITSKRKILVLVNERFVSGWDDPRLYTLIALRRRGIPPGAILAFVNSLGVSTATTKIKANRFEQSVRQYLENSAARLLMVTRPLKVTIENLPEDYLLMVDKPLHPKVPELGTSRLPFTRTIYIEKDDFRLEDSEDYFRLAPNKTVGLFLAPHPITCISYKTDPTSGEVTELMCKLENEGPQKKPKAYIQWVADHKELGSPVRVDETRIFHQLFKSDHPPTDFKSDINTNSLEVLKGVMVEVGFWGLAKKLVKQGQEETKARMEKAHAENVKNVPADQIAPMTPVEKLIGKEAVRFQGLRVGYFAIDKDSRIGCLDEDDRVTPSQKQGDFVVLNRIVTLKEDIGKAA